MIKKACIVLLLVTVLSCNRRTKTEDVFSEKNKMFEMISPTVSNINFENTISETLAFNFLNYSYIYNGGGVAVGDINNDGLDDIYFGSNQASNKLYLNKGDFIFEDITEIAMVTDEIGWTTGVSMIDINGDGWLDIYVCKSGELKEPKKRKNKLYINQKDGTFLEQARQFGLDSEAFSTQAYYLDFDKDGDVDIYLVNHRTDFNNNVIIDPKIQNDFSLESSDQLFVNDNGTFKDITPESGILNKAWGLSASIGDFNEDGWPDIYVANDFLEPDFLYINNKNNTFTNKILETFDHISANSMGSDYADINNDLKPDLIVLDMLSEDHQRSKENMATMSTDNFNFLVEKGYHHQYMSNMLQINLGKGTYSEIAQLSGIAKTDWSWAPLIADFNNDGFNDLFVTNGIKHDLSNQDFRNRMKSNIINRKKVTLQQAIQMMPATKLPNKMFLNNRDATFKTVSEEWGFDQKINSNGAAYSDLDNDGDLDIIINNQDDIATIYKNNQTNNFLTISLNSSKKEGTTIGTSVFLYYQNQKQIKKLYSCRGFQSSVTKALHFGLGDANQVDSIMVYWPDGKSTHLSNIKANKKLHINKEDHTHSNSPITKSPENITVYNSNEFGVHYKHEEQLFDDYALQLLLPQKQSEKGIPIAVADVNNDGKDDFFVGNAKGAVPALYIQNDKGTFDLSNTQVFKNDRDFEDRKSLFFDYDNDGDLDLFVASGSYEDSEASDTLRDRLYENDGLGNFIHKENALPIKRSVTSTVAFADIDNDGDLDIFIGSGVIPGKYPSSYSSYILQNENGKFVDQTSSLAKDLKSTKVVNDAIFSDYDNDGDQDLFIVGEWSPILIFDNTNGKFSIKKNTSTDKLSGWFNTIAPSDIDQDGDIDYVVGNLGDNNKFKPSITKPLHIYAADFDSNGSMDIVLSKSSKEGLLLPVRGKECSSQQVPRLSHKFKTYNSFASASLNDIYGKQNLENALHYTSTYFTTSLLKNNGNGNFDIIALPIEAQFGPTTDFLIEDFNLDGHLDIFGIGSLYEAEVETIRYDSNKGYFSFSDKKQKNNLFSSTFLCNKLTSLQPKAMEFINIQGEKYILLFNKNGELKFLKWDFKQKPL
ncbi:VCBS repeat-containing protein [Aquimarina sp. D1M17]|uniref:VCBS repeat-containing protein n=1 Tax=Aquimarina acroporae TaxID=2937283 RepID=UPI0020BD792A|nr:VCBS repeat-containing protein [Aquimarina acroporae]MCK8522947.1 VCBS repeat-containing protein [Aquimarina acroporae]